MNDMSTDGAARPDPDAREQDGDSRASPPQTDDDLQYLFKTTALPILLIDPARDGAIVDANPRAQTFYGYSRERFQRLYCADINVLGADVLPVMQEIASWEGGHAPRSFCHLMSDGSVRDVQVYAGPVYRAGRRLMLCVIHDVTAEVDTAQFNRLLLDSIHTAVCGIDAKGDFTSINPYAVSMLGFRHESELIRRNIRAFIAQEQDDEWSISAAGAILQVARDGQPLLGAECMLLREGTDPFPVKIYATPVLRHGEVVGAVLNFFDLTGKREREALVTDLANSIPGGVFQGIVRTGRDFSLSYVSAGASRLLGLAATPEAVSLATLFHAVHPDDVEPLSLSLDQAVGRCSEWQHEFRVLTGDGERWLLGRAQLRRRSDGGVLLNTVLLDITEKKQLEAELAHAAHHDALTGILNRRFFEQNLQQAHAKAMRYGQVYSVLLADIDNFKQVNDCFGHDVGDDVLRGVTFALSQRLRSSDCLARWGGEEFIILLPELNVAAAARVADLLRQTVSRLSVPPLEQVTISVGVAEVRLDETAQQLVKRADEALYCAKRNGRDRIECAG